MTVWGNCREPPARRRSCSYAIRIGHRKLHVGVGFYPDGAPCEVRVDCSSARVGSELRIALEVWATTACQGLQHGLPLARLARRLVGVQDATGGALDVDPGLGLGVEPVASSIWDGLGRVLLAVAEGC